MITLVFILSTFFICIQYGFFISYVMEENFESKKEFILLLIPFGPVIMFFMKAIKHWKQL